MSYTQNAISGWFSYRYITSTPSRFFFLTHRTDRVALIFLGKYKCISVNSVSSPPIKTNRFCDAFQWNRLRGLIETMTFYGNTNDGPWNWRNKILFRCTRDKSKINAIVLRFKIVNLKFNNFKNYNLQRQSSKTMTFRIVNISQENNWVSWF